MCIVLGALRVHLACGDFPMDVRLKLKKDLLQYRELSSQIPKVSERDSGSAPQPLTVPRLLRFQRLIDSGSFQQAASFHGTYGVIERAGISPLMLFHQKRPWRLCDLPKNGKMWTKEELLEQAQSPVRIEGARSSRRARRVPRGRAPCLAAMWCGLIRWHTMQI